MENDIIKERIFAIEDFENVDSALMEQINGNEEYRRLFTELREISELIDESVPEPVKNGVTLHDAVMERVKKGDIAPRYINTGFKFPFATVACLLICAAVVFAARSGLAEKLGRTLNESAVSVADNASYNYALYEESGGGSGVRDAKKALPDRLYEDVRFEAYSESEESTAESEYFDADDAEDMMPQSLTKNQSTEADYDTAPTEVFGGNVASYSSTVQGQSVTSTIADVAVDKSDSVKSQENMRDGTENAKAKTTSSVEAQSEEPSQSALISGGTKEDREPTLGKEALAASEYALERGVASDRLISAEKILEYGEELYVAWVNSIAEKENFSSFYSLEAFAEYCESAQK